MDAYEDNIFVLTTIHNVIRRSLVQVVKNCDAQHVPDKKKLRSFLGFAEATIVNLHSHHHHEDLLYFPLLKKYGIETESLSEEHKALEGLLTEVLAIVKSPKTDKKAWKAIKPSNFDFAGLKSKVEQIQTILLPHLEREELEHTAEKTRNSGLPSDVLIKCHEDIAAEAQKDDPTLVLPLLYYHLNEKELKDMWNAKFPFVLRTLIMPIFRAVHVDYWQFSYSKSK
ncbi:hypothetical protein BC830DRAFT_1089362 [Chytriomyces sp. MP71]|nr:hypothetical protein BC830DRAFT_1089362 [Chytriomyces sp. MP71]